jgi:hypothetical protein
MPAAGSCVCVELGWVGRTQVMVADLNTGSQLWEPGRNRKLDVQVSSRAATWLCWRAASASGTRGSLCRCCGDSAVVTLTHSRCVTLATAARAQGLREHQRRLSGASAAAAAGQAQPEQLTVRCEWGKEHSHEAPPPPAAELANKVRTAAVLLCMCWRAHACVSRAQRGHPSCCQGHST